MRRRRWFAGRARSGLGAVCALLLLGSGAWAAAAEEADWGRAGSVYEGASFVKDPQVCRECHDAVLPGFDETPHARAFQHGKTPERGDCEVCHGPASKHVEDPEGTGPAMAWEKLGPEQQARACLQCHEGGARMSWKGGAHSSSDVSCTSCHSVMAARSEKAMLKRPKVQEVCTDCHGEIRAKMAKASHHPVREGRMDCASCHNAHGSNPSLLKKTTLNETCVSCHTEKRGPFIWEHAPVRESCANCHEAHGSSNRNLLVRKDPFLCLQCHSYGGHVNLPRYNRVNSSYGSGCVNCHVTTHGSNHPSGAKQTR